MMKSLLVISNTLFEQAVFSTPGGVDSVRSPLNRLRGFEAALQTRPVRMSIAPTSTVEQ
jgi:hypothetical protein